jgi:hypothetical protein
LLPPFIFLVVFLVARLTGIGGRHSKVSRTHSVAACGCALNVTDTSAATLDPDRRGTPDQT